jgi:hypothetical protein
MEFVKSHKDSCVIIPLSTYDGSGETLHPSVLNLGCKWNGYQYWMANTPIPNGNSAYENPSIWASNDGENFIVPEGLKNPVVHRPNSGNNADTELFFENDILYLIYKEITSIRSGFRSVINLIYTSDGIKWTSPKTILIPGPNEIENVSPSLIKIGSKYYIYYFTGNAYKIHIPINPRICRVSSDKINGPYNNVEVINLPWDTGHIWWHLHIFNFNKKYYLSALRSVTHDPGDCIFIFQSNDGINFIKNNTPSLNGSYKNIDIDSYYRPCISTIDDKPVIYCGVLKDKIFRIMKMNIELS